MTKWENKAPILLMLALIQRIFDTIARKVCFTFAVVVFSLIGAQFGAGYAYFFGSGNIRGFSLETYGGTIMAFLIIMGLATFGHMVAFGLLRPLGFYGFPGTVARINRALENDNFRHWHDSTQLLRLLKDVVALPVVNVILAVFFATLTLGVVLGGLYIDNWQLNIALIIVVGWLFALAVYIGFCYLITDFFAGNQRAEIKTLLLERGVECQQISGLIRLKGKFIYLIFVTAVALSILAVNGLLDTMGGTDSVLFIGWTIVVTSILIFFYYTSIISSLQQIQAAAKDLASGGRGYLPIGSSDREFTDFAVDFTKTGNEVYSIRRNLQEKVAERTRDLETSLAEVKTLKDQQDGDYLLTSMLLEPLSLNAAESETTRIEFLVSQKKKFRFKKWDRELGGDLCVSHTIRLSGREYTVFLNADAMGKSMQGASGALVLGATFRSIIERTQFADVENMLTPERWLKDSFLELHRLFESFDGQMLISLFFGLVDANGLLYFINAEHPWTVLYRNGRAEFIEDELEFRKLGTPGLEGRLYVNTFQLVQGDVLIAGSDGRDDLAIATGSGGQRILNEDEKLFLRIVERAAADLPDIEKQLSTQGEFTDDLSLLRLEYMGNNLESQAQDLIPEARVIYLRAKELFNSQQLDQGIVELQKALKVQPESMRLHKLLFKARMKAKEYLEVVRLGEHILSRSESNPDILYYLARAYERTGRLEDAVRTADRLRLREPRNAKYSLLLAEIYMKSGLAGKASKYARKVAETDPLHARALKILGPYNGR